MDVVDSLLTVAEISVALAGFAGVIATFQLGQLEHLSRGRVVAVWMIVNISLFMAFFSVLPFFLVQLGLEEKTIWAISSALMVVYLFAYSPIFFRNVNMSPETLPIRILFLSFPIFGLALLVANLLNALGIIFDQELGPFLAAVIFSLCIVSYNFSRLLMRPLWKLVEKREVMSSAEGQ